MKLATALSERADLQRRISELGGRLNNNARVQDGEKPSEDPQELLSELNKDFERLEELIARINHTNNETKSGDVTLTDLIAKRDCLKQKIGIMRSFLNTASEKISRYSKTEIRILSTVSVSELQKELDKLSKELRETDETIQGVNWTTDLIWFLLVVCKGGHDLLRLRMNRTLGNMQSTCGVQLPFRIMYAQ